MILPKLGRIYITERRDHTDDVRFAKRDVHGRPVVASNGDGKLKEPVGGEYIDGDPMERYLSDCKARGHEPSQGALYGRDWRTGKVVGE